MRVLFDTNVLVAAVLSSGCCSEIVEQAVQEHELYTTPFVLAELKKVFHEKNLHPVAKPLEDFFRFLDQFFILGQSAGEVERVCRDPDDDQLLADAVLNNIDVLITGDKDLLVLKNHKGVRISSPGDYWTT